MVHRQHGPARLAVYRFEMGMAPGIAHKLPIGSRWGAGRKRPEKTSQGTPGATGGHVSIRVGDSLVQGPWAHRFDWTLTARGLGAAFSMDEGGGLSFDEHS